MSNFSDANRAFKNGELVKSSFMYEDIVKLHDSNTDTMHPMLFQYAKDQLTTLSETFKRKRKAKANIVLTSANGKYFNTLITMIDSVFETSNDVIDEIIVFYWGLERWQIELLNNLQKVKIFSYDDLIIEDERYKKFDINDPSTYFFKVVGFHHWDTHSSFDQSDDVNLLWIDAGIKIQRSLSSIFYLTDNDGAFFVDHEDVRAFYDNPENLVVNVMSPSLENEKKHYEPLTISQLSKPYVKANFFGIRTGGAYKHLIKEHLDFCLNTDVLFDPRNINDEKRSLHWIKKTSIDEVFKGKGIQNSGKYLYGRHEQAVWSYLVAKYDVTIHESDRFNFTVAPGSGYYTESNWNSRMKRLLEKNFDSFKPYIVDFVKNPTHFIDGEPPAKLETKSDIVDTFLKVGKEVFLTNPKYTNVGFPHPARASKSIALLHRGSEARVDQHKYVGRLLNNFNNIREDVFIMLGNGPSLADVDLNSLKGMHTFGLNAAYRAYERVNFWPKYFGCFDALVCGHHSENFKKLIRNSPIEKFFFININDEKKPIFPEPDIQASPKFQNIDFHYRTPEEKERYDILSTTFAPFTDMRTSGSNTIQAALLMGYRKFILLGVDQNYVEVVDGAKTNKNYHKLIMKETPKENPNYWFADYQQEGDKFNRPNLQKSQIPAWNNLSLTLDTLGINMEIYNCSPITALESFKKASLNFALRKLNSTPVSELGGFQSQLK